MYDVDPELVCLLYKLLAMGIKLVVYIFMYLYSWEFLLLLPFYPRVHHLAILGVEGENSGDFTWRCHATKFI